MTDMKTTTDNEVLRAEKLPSQPNLRRTRGAPRRSALGRGLGALLLRQQLAASAKQLPKLQLPAWADGFEPHQKSWLKKVIQRAG
jgi:hypothetical protein